MNIIKHLLLPQNVAVIEKIIKSYFRRANNTSDTAFKRERKFKNNNKRMI